MPPGRRLLFVTEKFPWPLDDGGQLRTWHVLAGLAAELPVTLASLAPPDPSSIEPVRALGVEVATFARRRSAARTAWYAAKALATRKPYPLEKNASRELLADLRRRIAAGGVLALHLNHLDAAQYVEDLGPGRPGAVVDTHNLLTRMYERFADAARDPARRAYCTVQWWKMARYERELLKQVERVAVCSDVEREQLRTWGIDRVLVVPNGVDTAKLVPDGRALRAGGPPSIVFVGALSYLPNADGVRWFLAEVAPRLESKLPGFRLTIAGKDPPSDVRARAVPGRVEVPGFVDDLAGLVRGADACVVPLRIGGGTRLKILDAMALGTPVVATRVGAEGILARDREHLLLGDTPDEIAAAVAEVCTDRALARRLSENGRRLVVERYDWKQAVAPLVEHYRELAR